MANEPTNAELLAEIKLMQATLDNHGLRLDHQDSRIVVIERAKLETDAVAKYLIAHPAVVASSESNLNKQLVKYFTLTLSIIGSLIYLLQGSMK